MQNRQLEGTVAPYGLRRVGLSPTVSTESEQTKFRDFLEDNSQRNQDGVAEHKQYRREHVRTSREEGIAGDNCGETRGQQDAVNRGKTQCRGVDRSGLRASGSLSSLSHAGIL